MAFRLEDGGAIGSALKQRLLDEIFAARNCLAEADRSTAVHRARRGLKRARSLLLIFRPVIGPDYARRRVLIRDAGRLLSVAREADVALATSGKIARRLTNPQIAATLVGRLAAEAADAHARAVDVDAAARLLRIAEADAATLPLRPDGTDFLEAAFAKAYARGRRDWKRAVDAGRHADEDLLHEWRKWVKHRLHLTMLVLDATPITTTAVADDLERLAEWLGDEHDLALLAARLGADPEVAGGTDRTAPILKAIKRRRNRLRRKALALGETLYGRKRGRVMRRFSHAVGAGADRAA